MEEDLEYPHDLLKQLYSTMLRIRLSEESIVEPILRGDIHTPCHLCSGEEAIATGLCAALTNEDYVFGNHRSHGHFLAKGGSIKELIAEIFCRETGCSRGRGGSMHLTDPAMGFMGATPIVAGSVSLAVGTALASSIRRDKRISIAFFGDGAMGEGIIYEAMNFASLKKLPIIFACENNLYATHMPIRECRVSDKLYKLAIPFGIHSVRVDGNDVLAVYQNSQGAIESCRRGDGPMFIEFMTYRQRGHVGPDDKILDTHTDIRSQEEIAKWSKKDPIGRFENYLLKNNIMPEAELRVMKNIIKKEVEKAHEEALQTPMPREKELFDYVFK
jgi:acetoin:2,6-dichlorophenolindophenol oxidoreductase subunit alpha